MIKSRQNSILGEASDIPLIGYCYTNPNYRRQGLYTAGLCKAIHKIKKMGYRKVIIETHPSNKYSKYGIKKAGFILSRSLSGFILFNKLCLFNLKTKNYKRLSLWFVH